MTITITRMDVRVWIEWDWIELDWMMLFLSFCLSCYPLYWFERFKYLGRERRSRWCTRSTWLCHPNHR